MSEEFWITRGVGCSDRAAGLFAYGTIVGIAARMQADPVGVMNAAIALHPMQPQLETSDAVLERRRLITVRALGATLTEEELQSLAQQPGNLISDHLARQAALTAAAEEEVEEAEAVSGVATADSETAELPEPETTGGSDDRSFKSDWQVEGKAEREINEPESADSA